MLRDHDWLLARCWSVPLLAAALLLVAVPSASGQTSSPHEAASPEASRDEDGYWPRDVGFAAAVAGVGAVDTNAWKSEACGECDGGPQVGAAFQLHFGYNVRRRVHVVGGFALVKSDPSIESGQSSDSRLKALTASLGVQYGMTPRWSVRSMVGFGGIRASADMDSARQDTSAPIPTVWASVEYKLMNRPMRVFALGIDTTLLVMDYEPVAFAFLSAIVRFHLPRSRSDT